MAQSWTQQKEEVIDYSRPDVDHRAMGKKSEIAHHRGQIPSGLGRHPGMSFGANVGKFCLAHVVAFQHAIPGATDLSLLVRKSGEEIFPFSPTRSRVAFHR
jgi:hypothetical protein